MPDNTQDSRENVKQMTKDKIKGKVQYLSSVLQPRNVSHSLPQIPH